MAAWVSDYYGQAFPFADLAQEADKPSHSKLLGPDGKPMKYARQQLGFDLRPNRKPQEQP